MGDTLGTAWDAVVALLPEGWIGPGMSPAQGANPWWCSVWPSDRGATPYLLVTGKGPTPIAALEALRAELERREVAK